MHNVVAHFFALQRFFPFISFWIFVFFARTIRGIERWWVAVASQPNKGPAEFVEVHVFYEHACPDSSPESLSTQGDCFLFLSFGSNECTMHMAPFARNPIVDDFSSSSVRSVSSLSIVVAIVFPAHTTSVHAANQAYGRAPLVWKWCFHFTNRTPPYSIHIGSRKKSIFVLPRILFPLHIHMSAWALELFEHFIHHPKKKKKTPTI